MQSLTYCSASNLFILEKGGRKQQNYLQVLDFCDISQSTCTGLTGWLYPDDEHQKFTLTLSEQLTLICWPWATVDAFLDMYKYLERVIALKS